MQECALVCGCGGRGAGGRGRGDGGGGGGQGDGGKPFEVAFVTACCQYVPALRKTQQPSEPDKNHMAMKTRQEPTHAPSLTASLGTQSQGTISASEVCLTRLRR